MVNTIKYKVNEKIMGLYPEWNYIEIIYIEKLENLEIIKEVLNNEKMIITPKPDTTKYYLITTCSKEPYFKKEEIEYPMPVDMVITITEKNQIQDNKPLSNEIVNEHTIYMNIIHDSQNIKNNMVFFNDRKLETEIMITTEEVVTKYYKNNKEIISRKNLAII